MPLTSLTSPRHQTTKINLFHVRFHTKAILFFILVSDREVSDVILLLLMLLLLLYGLWPLTSGFWPLAILILSIVASGLWLLASLASAWVFIPADPDRHCVSVVDRSTIDHGSTLGHPVLPWSIMD